MQVSSSENSVGDSSPRKRLHQLEVAPRGGRQFDQFAVALDRQPLHVRQRAALRVLGVAQQARRPRRARWQAFGIPGGQAGAAQSARTACARPAPPSNCQAGRTDSVKGCAARAAFRRCSKAGVTSAL